MAQYDFTVRAEDETGAFSDRTFNIEVQNNLVDKFAYSDGTDIYSSIDGVNWTQRIGKGSQLDDLFYENGYWVGIDSDQTERTSKDCINWVEHNGSMAISNLHSSFDGKILSFNYEYQNRTTINGWTYVTLRNILIDGIGGSAIIPECPLARTQDFVNFEIMQYDQNTTYNDVFDGYGVFTGNLQTTGVVFTNQYTSNIVFFNDYYIMASDDGNLYRSTSLSGGWELLSSGLTSEINNFNKLMNINGILVLASSNSTSNAKSSNAKLSTSTDGVNWTVVHSKTASVSSSYPTSYTTENNYFFYVNGYFIIHDSISDPNQLEFKVSKDLVNWVDSDLNFWFNRISMSGIEYKGQIYMCARKGEVTDLVIYDVDDTGLSSGIRSYLPTAPSTNMAVIK